MELIQAKSLARIDAVTGRAVTTVTVIGQLLTGAVLHSRGDGGQGRRTALGSGGVCALLPVLVCGAAGAALI